MSNPLENRANEQSSQIASRDFTVSWHEDSNFFCLRINRVLNPVRRLSFPGVPAQLHRSLEHRDASVILKNLESELTLSFKS